jgi:hypothetical protein
VTGLPFVALLEVLYRSIYFQSASSASTFRDGTPDHGEEQTVLFRLQLCERQHDWRVKLPIGSEGHNPWP